MLGYSWIEFRIHDNFRCTSRDRDRFEALASRIPLVQGFRKTKGSTAPDRWSPNSLKSYLFERRTVMNFGILRNEPRPLKNFAVLLSDETVGNFSALHGLPLLVDVVKPSRNSRAHIT